MSDLQTQLKDLGFTKASNEIKGKLALKKKLAIAYEFFRVVTPEAMQAYQDKLKEKTIVYNDPENKWKGCTYDRVRFTPIEETEHIPPEQCLYQLEQAQKRECFDTYEVADIETVNVRPDPIIFGRIEGSPDRFFITQWDDDIDINDILGD